jgi:hypothetical protein
MQEIIIPELLAGFFIAISMIRFFIRQLRNIRGLIWLPVLALGMIIALFPAYGFRPECIPLLLYGIFYALFNTPALVFLINPSRAGSFQEPRPICLMLMFGLLFIVLGIALIFAPFSDSNLLEMETASVTILDKKRSEELFLRFYSVSDEKNTPYIAVQQKNSARALRPLMILIPPVAGSVTVTVRVCEELRNNGFTVVTYSRRNFDSPAIGSENKKHTLSPVGRLQVFRVKNWGGLTAAATAIGRSMEEGRRHDIAFMLDFFKQNGQSLISGAYGEAVAAAFAKTDMSVVFLAGYYEGGGALLELSGSPDFTARYPEVKGIISVESVLFFALTREDTPAAYPSDSNRFIAVWSWIRSRAAVLHSLKINGVGDISHPKTPVCFIVSGKATNSRYREGRYAAILKVVYNTKAPVVLASAEGAGPLDYSDIPEKYPIYSVFRPGNKVSLPICPFRGTHGPEKTAALMTNFAVVVLTSCPDTEKKAQSLSKKALLPKNFHIEANSIWNSLKNKSIL